MVRSFYSTKSWSAIAGLLAAERRYLTATEVHRLLRNDPAPVSLSTVYRTLERLVAAGFASVRTREDGECAYVSCSGEHHHHAICRMCGAVEDVNCAAMQSFTAALRKDHGFALDDHALEFHGRCRRCR